MADPHAEDAKRELDEVEGLIEEARKVADRDRHRMHAEPAAGEITLTDAPDDDGPSVPAGSP
jgi:hypothetical protein